MEKSEQDGSTLRWSIAQRLEFIEFRLIWEGRINRVDISDRFGVTVQQATADLQHYERIAPENIRYDRYAKTFVPGAGFEPQFVKPLADRQLLQLAAIGTGLVEPQETWFSELPPIGVAPIPRRSVLTTTVRWILEAIRTRSAIDIEYQSVKRPAVIKRSIAPHALGHDGTRWHARAWCSKNRCFRDFVLSRMTHTGSLSPSTIDPEMDFEWTTEIELVLVPNPELGEGSRRSLAKEYSMSRGRLHLPVRAAMAFYAVQNLDLDLTLDPARQQLVLLNKAEVDAVCADARVRTLAALRKAGHLID